MYWIEIRPGLRRSGRIHLVPINQRGNFRGFTSVFGFDDATAAIIHANNSTANLRGVAVYADTLFMDFDDTDPVAFRELVCDQALAATEWHSGGRSYHFHIPLVPLCTVWAPHACKSWVRENAPTADMSFYTTSGMYRLPGTYHAKYPGRCKTLLRTYPGGPLMLTEPMEREHNWQSAPTGDSDFWVMLQSSKPPGQRTIYIWTMATVAAETGVTYAKALDSIQFWNTHQPQPHDASYVERKVGEAYRRAFE